MSDSEVANASTGDGHQREDAPEVAWESEERVADAIGRLIEFWGFKRHMGRMWATLYLSETPLPSTTLQSRLQLSSGSVSMTVQSLIRWGVAHRVEVEGERRDYFTAERDIWKMVSRVYAEREREEVLHAIDTMEDAIEFAEMKTKSSNEADRLRGEVQLPRIRQLHELANLGLRLINALVDSGRVDFTSLIGLRLAESESARGAALAGGNSGRRSQQDDQSTSAESDAG